MFTGIVTAVAPLVGVERSGAETLLTLRSAEMAGRLALGDSLAVNGVCLTVAGRAGPDLLRFHLSRETLRCSHFADLNPGAPLNLEPPLAASGLLGGHLVSGHVDGTVRARAVRRDAAGSRFSFTYREREWRRLLLPKGSVALNGVSLTLVEVQAAWFSVEIIPHTLQASNLGRLRVGERVNIELDFIGKYLYNLTRTRFK